MLWMLLLCCSVYASDIQITIEDQKLSSSHEVVADVIIESFFLANSDKIRDKIAPRLVNRLQHESQEFCTILIERVNVTPQSSLPVSDVVSERVLDLFTSAVEDALTQEEEQANEWKDKAESRCERTKVIMIAGALSLLSAATAAAVSAAITSAID